MVSGVSIKDSVLVDALESMRNYGKMHALVCPWGPLNETTKDELYKVVSSGIAVILPAGNEPSQKPPFDGEKRQADFAVAGAATFECLEICS